MARVFFVYLASTRSRAVFRQLKGNSRRDECSLSGHWTWPANADLSPVGECKKGTAVNSSCSFPIPPHLGKDCGARYGGRAVAT